MTDPLFSIRDLTVAVPGRRLLDPPLEFVGLQASLAAPDDAHSIPLRALPGGEANHEVAGGRP